MCAQSGGTGGPGSWTSARGARTAGMTWPQSGAATSGNPTCTGTEPASTRAGQCDGSQHLGFEFRL